MRLTALLDPNVEVEERDLPLGQMDPTHRLCPPAQYTHGHDAITLAGYCGYTLFDFQADGLIDKLGTNVVERRDGSKTERWAGSETCDVISRRNGKSVEIEVLILTGLFLLGERQIMYTAHRDDTAEMVFNNVVAAIKRAPKLWAEIVDKGPRYTNGQRRIELKNGAVCFFRTRTADTARGQGYDRLILDEAQNLTEGQMAALMPLVSGNEGAQLNYAGSAGGLASTVLAKVWRSYQAKERSLCYRGWHAEPDSDYDDLDLIARLNPRLGRGLDYEFIAKEFNRMTLEEFGRERCGVATYPREEGAAWVIPEEAWKRALDEGSAPAEGTPLAFVAEADPSLEAGSICLAGRRPDGAMHVEVLAHDPGVEWIVAAAKSLTSEHRAALWLDPKGPIGFMVGDLRKAEVPLRFLEATDLRDGASWFYTAANPQPDPKDPGAGKPAPRVYHRGGKLLTRTLAAAETRKLLGQWSWRRSVGTGVNQGPLIGATMAGWAIVRDERSKPPPPPPQSIRTNPGSRPHSRPRNRSNDLAEAGF